jgi:glycosyltransferase 2 family protein
MSTELRRKIIYSLVFALLVYVGLALYSDWGELRSALSDFPWHWLPVVIALTLVNYTGRMLRWHWYLRTLGVPIRMRDSARIFGVGMLMVMTPGKAGEFLKSYMVKNVAGTPMSTTAPVVLAERAIDGAAMLLLSTAGLFAFPDRTARIVGLFVFGSFAMFVVLIQIRPLAVWVLRWGERMPFVRRFVSHLHAFYESCYIVFRPRNLTISILVGMLCWGAEGMAYFVVLVGFGVEPSALALVASVFIFTISTVIGAVFALPGGLGGVEGSLVALSRRIFDLSAAAATGAALLIRFSTLWFGVGIGVVCFLLWPQLLAGAEEAQRNRAVAQVEVNT